MPTARQARRPVQVLHQERSLSQVLDSNVTGTFIVNDHIANTINMPLGHSDATNKHPPFWTTEGVRGVNITFVSAAANTYARVLSYGPSKPVILGLTRCQ